jgi:glyoxylase-like metal-dependent hydrolase (beta-lactamase superfamily II)
MIRVQEFFDKETSTLTYVVYDEASRDAVVLDPVLDLDPASGLIWTESVQKVIAFVKGQGLHVLMILETHAHADHLSGSQELKRYFPDAKVAIGENIRAVQSHFNKVYNLDFSASTNGAPFDRLLKDKEEVRIGTLRFEVVNTPGHTPACTSFRFDNLLFTGDSLLMPDSGTGRCDFPGGSAEDLYQSVTQRIYTLPGETMIYTGHDYQPDGRPLKFMTSVDESRSKNVQLNARTSQEEFVRYRKQRDAQLQAPRLLHPSVQVNIAAGHLPKAEENGTAYLKIPLRML